jgi:Lhr-like helicase
MDPVLARFHPAVRAWFSGRFPGPTEPQRHGWPAIAAGEHTLITAPTGSGKTLAAFLWTLDDLVQQAVGGSLDDRIHVVYVSPLKALNNDIHRNLAEPLAGIRAAAAEQGVALPELRAAVRTGDTPAPERAAMSRRPPHVLITTPESLFILLASERMRRALAHVRYLIVDEIHAVAGTKRGAHLALSLERLTDLAATPPVRIGLSATVEPVEEIAGLLTGAETPGGPPRPCRIVDVGRRRTLDLEVVAPTGDLGAIATIPGGMAENGHCVDYPLPAPGGVSNGPTRPKRTASGPSISTRRPVGERAPGARARASSPSPGLSSGARSCHYGFVAMLSIDVRRARSMPPVRRGLVAPRRAVRRPGGAAALRLLRGGGRP